MKRGALYILVIMGKSEAINAIKKKLKGQALSDREIFSLMDEIAHRRLGPVLTTYFAAAGFSQGFSNKELYYLTKAMVETGQQLKFDGVVADKHSIGGLAGMRTSMILVPIVAAAGIKIPKASSRAITTAAGTADTMEVLAPVDFPPGKIKKIVEKVKGCIVWAGHLGLAPADDVIIQVERPLAIESFDKIIVSVMAKKVAVGSTYVVIDIPWGPFMKVRHKKDSHLVAKKFHFLAEKFKLKLTVEINHTLQPGGYGVGPVLETDDVLAVLERAADRPRKLEQRALGLAEKLLELCYKDSPGKQKIDGYKKALELLDSGKALDKLREIVQAQGGDPDFSRDKLRFGEHRYELKAKKSGKISAIDTKKINAVARILGSPEDKAAGVKLSRRLGDKVGKGDILSILYSSDRYRLKEARETLSRLPMYYLDK